MMKDEILLQTMFYQEDLQDVRMKKKTDSKVPDDLKNF